MANEPLALSFEEAWAEKEKAGYQYGEDALEQVRFGWEIAMDAYAQGKLRPLRPEANESIERPGITKMKEALCYAQNRVKELEAFRDLTIKMIAKHWSIPVQHGQGDADAAGEVIAAIHALATETLHE